MKHQDVSKYYGQDCTIETKIPDVISLVKKTEYNTKVTEIENKLNNHNYDKYITAPEVNTLATFFFSHLIFLIRD